MSAAPPALPHPGLTRLFVTEQGLRDWADDLRAAGTDVIGPALTPATAADEAAGTPARLTYRVLTDGAELDLSGALPEMSLKEFFLPQQETLCRWRQKGTTITLDDVPTTFAPRVVLAAKPCDSAGAAVVDAVMNWDYQDELWNGRRAATTIFNLSCGVIDDSCFCVTLGSSPDDTKGADGLLTPVAGGYLVEATTDRGRALLERYRAHFRTVEGDEADALATEAHAAATAARERSAANLHIEPASIRDWIGTNQQDPLLANLGTRCNGCGACTAVCPTCHCFDILDEPEGVSGGARRRCWDTCQSATFTVHASGHNPRGDQHTRYRQRINHKFSIYPLKFGEVLCTGCGRCVRVCHAGQDLVEILGALNIAATSTAHAGGAAHENVSVEVAR